MNVATSSIRPQTTFFGRLRAHLAQAWAIHLRTCEIMAESHRRPF